MNKAEFTDRVKGLKYEDLDETDFEIINTVYAYHPMISNVKGKDEIAALYKKGGMGIMREMYATAEEISMHESNIQANTVALENLRADNKKELDRMVERHNASVLDIVNDNIAADDRLREINESFNRFF